LIGIYTGTQGPGILQSTGSQLTFWFTSNSSGTGNFAASIECFGQALQEYPMSSGTVTTCSGVFTDNGGKLQNYPILENRVQTFCASGSQKMKFVFNPLAFKLSSNDTLWVYDGNSTSAPLLGYYLEGSFVEDLTSSGTCLTFRFKSDLSTSTVDQGWSAVLSCTSEIPGNLVYPMSTGLRVVCSGIFTDNGNLTGNYSNSANQIQTFQSPNNTRLEFSFSQFQTQSASDLLIVYDGPGIGYPEIGRYYLSINPGTIRSTGNSLTFWFISNSTSSAPGWAASFTCAGPALPEYNMTNGTVNACEGRWFDDGGATGVYGNNRNLIQTFCSPTGQRMMFTFSRFVTNLFPSDTLFAYDGNSITAPLIGAYALQGEFEPVVSSGSCITFRFKSDASLNAAGWAAVFACTDNPPQPPVYKHRSGIRVACSGFFTDNGGPADNYSYLGPTTTYTFQSETAGARLQFNFSQFSTRLNLDILRVYDGPSAASSLLGSFSGFNSPGILTSTGSTLTFVFTHPSTTASAPGWVASIQCLANVPLVGTLPAGPYCAGATVSVPFTSPDQIDGNVFSAQLSDASGQFSNPTTVGTLTGTSSGTISVLLPSGLSSSGLYRLRILGSSPALAGSPSSPFTVLAIPTQPGAIAGPDNLCAGAGNAQYNVGLVSGALSYTWSVPAGASIVSGQGTNAIVVRAGFGRSQQQLRKCTGTIPDHHHQQRVGPNRLCFDQCSQQPGLRRKHRFVFGQRYRRSGTGFAVAGKWGGLPRCYRYPTGSAKPAFGRYRHFAGNRNFRVFFAGSSGVQSGLGERHSEPAGFCQHHQFGEQCSHLCRSAGSVQCGSQQWRDCTPIQLADQRAGFPQQYRGIFFIFYTSKRRPGAVGIDQQCHLRTTSSCCFKYHFDGG
jgi:hypothetical protein